MLCYLNYASLEVQQANMLRAIHYFNTLCHGVNSFLVSVIPLKSYIHKCRSQPLGTWNQYFARSAHMLSGRPILHLGSIQHQTYTHTYTHTSHTNTALLHTHTHIHTPLYHAHTPQWAWYSGAFNASEIVIPLTATTTEFHSLQCQAKHIELWISSNNNIRWAYLTYNEWLKPVATVELRSSG